MQTRPRYYLVQFAMGVYHGHRGETDSAIPYFQEVVNIFPYFAEAYFNLGVRSLKGFFLLFKDHRETIAKALRSSNSDLPPYRDVLYSVAQVNAISIRSAISFQSER